MSAMDTEKLVEVGITPLPHCTLLNVTWAFFTVTEYSTTFRGKFSA